MSAPELSRRSALGGGALCLAAGVAGFLVARRSDAAEAGGSAAADPYGSAPAAANAYGAPPAADTARPLVRLDEVPAGGGIVLAKRRVVLTRDATGTVRGFSALCTHQGCNVSTVRAGVIECPCHGSRFDAGSGAVVRGPATQALGKVPVAVRDGAVFPGSSR